MDNYRLITWISIRPVRVTVPNYPFYAQFYQLGSEEQGTIASKTCADWFSIKVTAAGASEVMESLTKFNLTLPGRRG